MVKVAYWEIEAGPLFLGVSIGDWLEVLTCVRKRRITVLDLLHQFEVDHPLNYNYLAWKKHFGVMAELQDEQEGFDG